MSTNSSRKYRPDIFDKILGQNDVILSLKEEIKRNNIPNAYLFYGPRGTGKTTTARVLAKAINCENLINSNLNPCNKCKYCTNNENTFELDAASNNSVEDIRTIIDRARFVPIFSKWNIFIIDEVHMLSQSAFTSFLKTLEEPPKNTLFILITTEINKIPSTIISRCQLQKFQLIENKIIIDELKNILDDKKIEYDDESLYIISEKANGGLRDALSILDSVIPSSNDKIESNNVKKILNILDDEIYFNLLENLIKADNMNILINYNGIIKSGISEMSFLEGLISFFLNLFLSKDVRTLELINKTDTVKNKFCSYSKNIKITNLEGIIELINKESINYKNTINKALFMYILLIDISKLASMTEN